MKNPLLELLQHKDAGPERDANPSPSDFNGTRSVFRTLADNSSDMILFLHLVPRFRLVYVNPACEAVTGYRPAEFHENGKLLFDIIHPDDRAAYRAGIKSSLPGADREPSTVRCVHANGSVIWTEHSKTAITGAQGRTESVLLIIRDITARKRNEEALKESQEFNSTLMKHAPHGVMVLNPDTSIRYVNPAWEELNGWTLDEIIGQKAPYPWWPKEEQQELLAAFKEAVKLPAGTGETFATKKNGDRYYLAMSWVNIRENGRTKYILLNSLDITEKNRMEKELKDSREVFAAAFRSSPDLMALIDAEESRYLEVNESFAHFTGYSREELVGRTDGEVSLWAAPEDRGRMMEMLESAGSFRHEEFQFRDKQGKIITWLCSADIISVSNRPCILAVATDITERRLAQEALRQSEERFFKAFNSSPGSISISRLSDSRFIEVNESFLREKGFTREEVIGRTAEEIGLWADPADRERIIKLIRETGSAHNELIDFRTGSGEIRTGYYSADTIIIGDEPCIIVQTTDITRMIQAEEQLRLLSSITEQVSDSTIITDPHFKITYINNAARELLGYTPEEVYGRDLSMFNDAPVGEESGRRMMAALNSGKAWTSEVRKRRKDGTTFIAEARISPLLDEGGSIISYIDIQRDITAQKEAEERLQASKDLVESILASMPEGVLVIGQDDRVVLANDAFCSIFNIKNREVTGRPFDELVPFEQLTGVYNDIKQARVSKQTLEFRYHRKDNERIIFSIVIGMPDGRVLLTFFDITREREEEAKLYLTDRLASIGEMAAGLAHELNNPLTGIIALSQMLLEGAIPKEQREDMACIHDEAKRAANIVKNVLLFTRNSQSDSGRSSANDVIKDVLRLREYEARLHDITVVTDLENGLPDVPVDKYQCQQVILNMILNAEAAIREGGKPGVLTVTTGMTDNKVVIEIRDNGCGIRKSVLPRIFDPFFTTKEIGKGTGLGLSICYGIIVKHGGNITVESRPAEGAVFRITLPAVKPDDGQEN